MKSDKAPMILYTDKKAAIRKRVTGWVSRTGRFCGNDEHMARWEGCTHTTCECGSPVEKNWTKCEACRRIGEIERYNKRERQEWDGDSTVYSDAHDRYFMDLSEVLEYCEDEGCTVADLRLIICEPNYPSPIDPNEHFCDYLPEDGDVPSELAEAFEALNAVIEKCSPLSWSPGKYAAIVKETEGATQ